MRIRDVQVGLRALVIVSALSGVGCAGIEPEPTDDIVESELPLCADLSVEDASLATAWMELVMARVKAESVSPPVASRIYGYAGITLYEGLVHGARPDYRSLVTQLNDLRNLPRPRFNSRRYDWPTVANAALTVVAHYLFSNGNAETSRLIDELAAAKRAERSASGTEPASLELSEAYGKTLGEALIEWASRDGFAKTRGLAYTPPVGPGFWVPTGAAPATALPAEPYWGTLRPFVLRTGEECAAKAPLPFSEDPTSAFFAQARSVYDASLNLTAEQHVIARYWADNSGATPTPPGHWVGIVTDLVRDAGLMEAAEAYAIVGLAATDAFIAAWHTKYTYNVLRPETYIRRNIDPSWTPYLPTPLFPEYTSGHSTVSGAAAAVLTDLYGDIPFTEITPVQPGFEARSFANFTAAAEEAAQSRLYAGIHYPMGNQNGLAQGACVGGTINRRVRTRR
jgi:hypothetical protein